MFAQFAPSRWGPIGKILRRHRTDSSTTLIHTMLKVWQCHEMSCDVAVCRCSMFCVSSSSIQQASQVHKKCSPLLDGQLEACVEKCWDAMLWDTFAGTVRHELSCPYSVNTAFRVNMPRFKWFGDLTWFNIELCRTVLYGGWESWGPTWVQLTSAWFSCAVSRLRMICRSVLKGIP